MTRFYLLLGTTLGIVAGAWSISSFAQDAPPHPPAGIATPMVPPMGPAFAPFPPPFIPPFPPPAPMMMAGPGPGLGGHPGGFMPPPPHGPGPGAPPRPAEMCLEVIAGKSAVWGYLRARLNLTPQQLTAWREVETALTENEQEERDACAKLPTKPEDVGFVQRAEGREAMLTLDLAHMKKLDGPIQKLTAMLSPEQRQVLDRLPPFPL